MADNYRIEAFSGINDHLTIKGKRTKRLSISFDLPIDVANDVHFTLIDPKGNEFSSSTSKNVSIIYQEETSKLIASSLGNGDLDSKRVEMIFKPDYKLQKGTYTIKICNSDEYLGSTQIRFK
ncbi:hypothetical protein OM075_17065 [Marinilabiliaceae bacterium AAT]|uniref:Uncharacterized protein n=1 Tax=Plebeiibacterium sediminum TaxID=2992112 RepID=A0AAE3M7W6_9BACT|nr:hypothetical protein [Plebeiobacterium sediminum]